MQHRQGRVEETIRTALAEIIQRQLRDPRLPMIFNITTVRVTRDLQEAKVYFTQLPDSEADIDETLDLLEHAKGFLRSEMGKHLRLRYTPILRFYYDESLVNARRIDELLASANVPPAPDESGDED